MKMILARRLPGLLAGALIAVFMLGFPVGIGHANDAWKSLRGYSTCGGVDQNGRLQPSCAAQRATFVKTSVKKCPAGSFLAQGLCYACPAGFSRDLLRKADNERACARPVSNSFVAATFLGKRECPAGSFLDGRNGGECWTCPAGYGRTAAAVDAWNACGVIGKKAVSAEFKGKACPDGFGDPRNGGECWSCPDGTDRTISPVTGPRACQRSFEFANAEQTGDFSCEAGQIFDLIDGGSCWTCPTGYNRSWSSIKAPDACVTTKMDWVMPDRQGYSIFGLGNGADDILAKLIAERTTIDGAIAKIAEAAGENVEAASAKAWEVIENRPSESVVLTSVLLSQILEIADKPAGERSAAENDLLARVGQIVQWNRQFIAYQARQAHDAHMRAGELFFAQTTAKMGAASVYASNPITPPDYNEVLMNSLQLGAGAAGPVSGLVATLSIKSLRKVILPFRDRAAKKAVEEGVKIGAKKALEAGGRAAAGGASGATSTAFAAALGPALIAAAAAAMISMELDKYMKIEEADGKIRQAIDIANRPVDLSLMLQQEGGSDEFMFHWAAVMNGKAQPSANFARLLASYKSGAKPADVAAPVLPPRPTGTAPTANTTTSTGAVELNGGLGGVMANLQAPTAPAAPAAQQSGPDAQMQTFLARLEKAVLAPSRRQPEGSLRVELSSKAGQCMTTVPGQRALQLMSCKEPRIVWLKPDARTSALNVAEQFCMDADAQRGPGQRIIRNYPMVSECDRADRAQRWQLTAEGFIRIAGTDQCISADPDGSLSLRSCGTDIANQAWRPWSGGS